MSTETGEYLTPEQVGEALSLSRNTVYALIAQHQRGDPAGLRAKKMTARKWIVHRDWLRAYVERRGGPDAD